MNIWKIIKNEGYNNAFLIDSSGKQRFDKDTDYMDMSNSPPLRTPRIEFTEKGFPDIMNYWGTNGAIIVNSKVKDLIEQCYGTLAIQFIPCLCSNCQDLKLWIWNVCEYHYLLDFDNSICDRIHNLQGKEVIKSVEKYVFRKKPSCLIFFKSIWRNVNTQRIYLYLIDLRLSWKKTT